MPKLIPTILLLLLSLLALPCYAEYAYAPVITFNMANYNDHKHWPERLKLMVDEIEANHADIIVLQEVRFDRNEASTKASYHNMAEQLLTSLQTRNDFRDAQIVTQPVMYYGNTWEGLSIISKYPIISTGSVFLNKSAACTDNNKRATQYAKINMNDNIVYIANTHFGLTKQCIHDNIKETAAYLQHMASKHPLLLLGDFNTTPDNQDLSLFTKIGLHDVWLKAHPNQPGYTFPANHPTTRIDYIYANNAALERIQQPEHVRVIGQHTSRQIHPSDHLGIVAEILAW